MNYLTIAAFMLLLTLPVSASVEFYSKGKTKAYTKSAQDWCTEVVEIEIRTQKKKLFHKKAKRKLQKFVRKLGQQLVQSCSSVKAMRIVGYAKGENKLAAAALKRSNWELTSDIPSDFTSSSPSSSKKADSTKSSEQKEHNTSANSTTNQAQPKNLPIKGADGGKNLKPGMVGKSTWRFQIACGRESLRGFIDLSVSGGAVNAGIASISDSQYRSQLIGKHGIGLLNAKGRYDSTKRLLTLKPSGFPSLDKKMPPINISATLQQDGYTLIGDTDGTKNCNRFSAWKTGFDTRKNAKGIIQQAIADGGFSNSRLPGKKSITNTQCETLLDWFVSDTMVKTQDTKLSAALIDSDRMLDVLGFTYDAMSSDEIKAFDISRQHCVRQLKNSANITHAQLVERHDKIRNTRVIGKSLGVVALEGGKINRRGIINPGWYKTMYHITAIRDARRKLAHIIPDLQKLPIDTQSLSVIEQALDQARSTDGLLASLPKPERDKAITAIKSIQTKYTRELSDKKLATIDWNSFTADEHGLKKLEDKKRAIIATMPKNELSRIENIFSTKKSPLSRKLADKVISTFPEITPTLEGLRDFKTVRKSYTEKYQSILVVNDWLRLTKHMDAKFYEATKQATPEIRDWVNLKVPKNAEGRKLLDRVSYDLFNVSVYNLKPNHFSQHLALIANDFVAKREQIKREECVVPKGFEEMRATLCNK